MMLRNNSTTSGAEKIVVECNISTTSLKYRLNHRVVTATKYRQFLRKQFGFDTPCFFIEQSRATSLTHAPPPVLWSYLQDTTGEKLLRCAEEDWNLVKSTIQTKYHAIMDKIASMRAVRDQGTRIIDISSRVQQLEKQLSALRGEVTQLSQNAKNLKIQEQVRMFRNYQHLLLQARENQQSLEARLRDTKIDSASITQDLDEVQHERARHLKHVIKLEEDIASQKSLLDGLESFASESRATMNQRKATMEQFRQAIHDKDVELAKIDAKIDYFERHINGDASHHDLDVLEHKRTEVSALVASVDKELADTRARIRVQQTVQTKLRKATAAADDRIQVRAKPAEPLAMLLKLSLC